jgi:hypothetical protein
VCRHFRTLDRFQADATRRWIKISQGPQQPGFADTRGSLDGEAFAVGDLERQGRKSSNLQSFDAQHARPSLGGQGA